MVPLPLAGVVGGGAASDSHFNLANDTLNIAQNIIIGESQKLVSMIDEISGSLRVIALLCFMRISVNFYNQSQFTAQKVSIIGANGHLSAEFAPTDLPLR